MDLVLLDPNTFDKLADQALVAIYYDDISASLKLLVELRKLWENQGAAVQQQDIKLYRAYLLMQTSLEFVCFPALSDKRCLDLILNNLLDASTISDYDLVDKIGKKINYIEIESEQINFMQELLKALQNNQELLTAAAGKGGEAAVPMSVKNLLADYENFPKAAGARGNLQQVEYVNKGKLSSQLDKQNRDELLEILKIYDSLKTRIAEYNSTPVPKSEEEAFKNFNLADMLPGLTPSAVGGSAPAPMAAKTASDGNTPSPLPSAAGNSAAGGSQISTKTPAGNLNFAAPPKVPGRPGAPQLPRLSLQDVLTKREAVGSGRTGVGLSDLAEQGNKSAAPAWDGSSAEQPFPAAVKPLAPPAAEPQPDESPVKKSFEPAVKPSQSTAVPSAPADLPQVKSVIPDATPAWQKSDDTSTPSPGSPNEQLLRQLKAKQAEIDKKLEGLRGKTSKIEPK